MSDVDLDKLSQLKADALAYRRKHGIYPYEMTAAVMADLPHLLAELRHLRATVAAMAGVVEHFGQAGHFCAADKCRFHLHSHVNGFCVSTVGEWRPEDGEMRWLAAAPESFYETMVFVLVDGDHDGNEIYCKRYATRDEANAGHVAAVENYRASKAKESK